MREIDRRKLTFSQAQGLAPLPQPLALGEISDEARALIWAVIYASLAHTAKPLEAYDYQTCLGAHWQAIERDRWVRVLHRPIDEFHPGAAQNLPGIKMIVNNWNIEYLFDFLTYVMRHRFCPDGLEKDLATAFVDGRLAYRIREHTIWPAATEEEGATILRALADLAPTEYGGARSHLKDAGVRLKDGEWADSIRESIHAVESVAKVIEPSAQTLSEALKKLSNAGRMNPNLKRGLEALYA